MSPLTLIVLALLVLALIGACLQKWNPAPLILTIVAGLILVIVKMVG